MTTPALATLTRHRSDLVPILAILSLAFGISAALRLDAPDRTSLMLAGAGCVAVGVTAAQFQSPSKRAVGAGSLAAGAGVALGQQTLDIESTALASLAWILAIAGTACWARNSVLLARFVLLPAAAVAFAFPLLAHGVGTRSPATAIELFAAIAACATLGTAVSRLQIVTPKSVHLPSAALWGVAGATAIAAAISTEYTWTALTLFTIAAAMLADALLLAGDRQEDAHLAPDRRVVPTTLATAACAGALAIASLAAGKPYGWPVAGAAIAGLSCLAAIVLNSAARTDLILARLRHSAKESRIDALTGLPNRRGFDERAEEEIARAARYGHPLALLMIDIDDFKSVNDRHGHAAGDRTLQQVAATIERSIRTIDIAARFGGEEFVVLLPETSRSGAAVVADRIRAEVAQATTAVPVTVSIGVADLDDGDRSRLALLDRADRALYRAKRSGKNRVELVG